jgi:hypothetical protein
MNTEIYLPATPATAYQLYLVSLGHSLSRHAVDGTWCLVASPDRTEWTPNGKVGHIPFADENAADEFADRFESANSVVGCDRP